MDFLAFLDNEYFGNTVRSYLLTLGFFIGAAAVLLIFEKIVVSRFKKFTQKTALQSDDSALKQFDKIIIPLLYLGAFYFSVSLLTLDPTIQKLVQAFCVIVLTIQMTRLALAVAIIVLDCVWIKNRPAALTSTASKSIQLMLKIVFWGLAFVFILDNLGFNVSAVVAGLGISGIAVAFALQAILGDLFNYFVIFFDKPFEEGDFVIIDDYLGNIEHVGVKTTRIRSLSGEQLVFSNSDLTSSRIRNYKRMEKRRVLFKIGVIYQTTLEQMRKAPMIIQRIIEGVKDTEFDRSHFKAFGDFSLDIEVVYYILSSDYNKYMNIQQEINYKIMDAFAKEGLEFAYPTQTLYVSKAGAGEEKREGVS